MPSISEFIILIAIGFGTGFINTVAGGGSLVTLPVLMFMGLPHTIANGTNRIGILFQTVAGLAGFRSKSVTSFPLGLHQGLISIIGAAIGVYLALNIEAKMFNTVLSVIMVVVVFLTLMNPMPRESDKMNYDTKTRYALSMVCFFLIGIYGGFIQAGLGFLSVVVSIYINGITIHKANHLKTFVTFCITVLALVVFMYEGQVVWSYGICLAVSSSAGAWIASRWSLEKEEKTLKTILLVSVLVLAFKLMFPDVTNTIIYWITDLFI